VCQKWHTIYSFTTVIIKFHFHLYILSQTLLFLSKIDKDITQGDLSSQDPERKESTAGKGEKDKGIRGT
jgi:hypothetical protein